MRESPNGVKHEHPSGPDWLKIGSNGLLVGFLAIGAFFFLTEHRAHLLGIFPYLLLLACPLLHFLHGGHGGHAHGVDPEEGKNVPAEDRHSHGGKSP